MKFVQKMSNWASMGVLFLVALFGLVFDQSVPAASPGKRMLPGHMPAVMARLTPTGRLPGTNNLSLGFGLPLRNRATLDDLLRQIYDPRSANFHKFLTTPEFADRFGPTEEDYQ